MLGIIAIYCSKWRLPEVDMIFLMSLLSTEESWVLYMCLPKVDIVCLILLLPIEDSRVLYDQIDV